MGQENLIGATDKRAFTAHLAAVQREGGPIEEIRLGDVVWFEPGEMHWHGASESNAMP